MKTRVLRAKHVYAHEPSEFEIEVNAALEQLVGSGAVIDEVRYAIDPSTGGNRRGGFGVLLLYEQEVEAGASD
ncbi:MAG: hypothetical protein IT384_29405 [Deltaproteobacteria bacterium]|nr:hypothetical protein [Deltaproteobacteria bacterium]